MGHSGGASVEGSGNATGKAIPGGVLKDGAEAVLEATDADRAVLGSLL